MTIAVCPIPGCKHAFEVGIRGWHTHVAALERHPEWHAETPDPIERQSLFQKEFPEWLGQNARPSSSNPHAGFSTSPPPRRTTRPPTFSRAPSTVPGPLEVEEASGLSLDETEASLDKVERQLVRMLATVRVTRDELAKKKVRS